MESPIQRFSSRRQRLDKSFLAEKLRNARSYKRIAGYFRSSIFEIVGEEVAQIPDVKIVCNSELDVSDIMVSKAVREAAIKEKWNSVPVEVESLLHRKRYRKLYELLSKGNIEIRVVPKDRVFVHGKAGVIETEEGKTCFLGSINETKSAFVENYEILWEDPSAEGVQWVEEEFDALWKDAIPLPEAIIEEIKRVADRVEVKFEALDESEIPGAALAESPIYRGGEQLQPWQRSFVAMFLDHRETYGQARLLLADEVGLGKTLSLGTSAMVSALLDDGPVLILCPSTLTFQWQVELKDRLGIPSAVWRSSRKDWIDPSGHIIRTNGAGDIAKCPFRIAIVSTGLIVHDSEEKEALLGRRYGTVVLDEAHKARKKGGVGESAGSPNNLLDFMQKIGARTKNLLLGTATPIQTEVQDLWDLLYILNSNVDFVLGRQYASLWKDRESVLPFIKGEISVGDERKAWDLIRSPLPPAKEDTVFQMLRTLLGIEDKNFFCQKPFGELDFAVQENVRTVMEASFFRANNPIVRHTILRRRDYLEEKGYLERIAVRVHPLASSPAGAYPTVPFEGFGLKTNLPFNLAYKAAERFTEALRQRTKAAGFMKSLLLQRLCSSFASGINTSKVMLERRVLDDEEDPDTLLKALDALTEKEAGELRIIIEELSRAEAKDPKLNALHYFLTRHRTEGKTWLEHGCIVFSQYCDTVQWVASNLADLLSEEPIAIYAGHGKSGLFRGGEFNLVGREEIKAAVKAREVRLVIATDAACEGLNLQTLGTLINIDLPWNPSRLEQRLGRIKRFGQARKTVDMLNLVYHGTQDEHIYEVISRRLKDKFDIFGGLPDIIEDEWIDSQEELEKMMDEYIHMRKLATNAFDMRYQTAIEPESNRWEMCSRVLSRNDVVDKLSQPW